MPKSTRDHFFEMLAQGMHEGAASARQGAESDAALERLLKQEEYERPYKDADSKYHNRMAGVAEKGAETTEQWRQDQIRLAKFQALFGKGGVGTDGKPLSNEAQKTTNLIDTGREALNNTEDMLKQHPIAGALETVVPDFAINKWGGDIKQIKDSKAATKEAMQNIYTGAAASGEQVPAFQGFSGPGTLDILSGKVDTSQPTRDAMNTLQQGYNKQARQVSPDMLKAAGMQNDPMAQQALSQQDAGLQAKQQQRLAKLTPADQEIFQEIQRQPTHPNAAAHKQRLVRRYGNIF